MNQNAKLVLNDGGAKGVRGAEMDQNADAKFVLNNMRPKGSEGPKWIKAPNLCLTFRVIW